MELRCRCCNRKLKPLEWKRKKPDGSDEDLCIDCLFLTGAYDDDNIIFFPKKKGVE